MKVVKDKGLVEWKIEEFGGEGGWYAMLVNKWEEEIGGGQNICSETSTLCKRDLKPYEDHAD